MERQTADIGGAEQSTPVTTQLMLSKGLVAGSLGFGLLCLGVALGVLAARNQGPGELAGPQWNPVSFAPDSAARSENMSMATGLVGENVEGLFVLDHVNGNLNGMVINPRTGQTGAVYTTNVFSALGISKDNADLVMTTGRINVPGNKGNQNPALCVVYVGDAATGKVAGFSLFYNQALANQGGNQGGTFQLVFSGQTRGDTINRN